MFLGYDYDETGECIVEIEAIADKVGEPLDFTAETAPVPAADDLWTWDAASKTLTLKNGFSLTVVESKPAILLPDGSTVIVEGKASVNSYKYEETIECEVYADGALTVENIAVNIEAQSDGFFSYGDTVIKNAKLDFDTYDESIDANGTKLLIENSDVNLYSEDEEGIDASGTLEVIGGKLVVLAYENALEAEKITLTNVIFDLKTIDNDYTFIDINEDYEGFALPGTFRLYDIDGKQIYEGEWKDELLDEYGEFYVGETEVFGAASVVQEEPEPEPKPEPKGDTVVIKIGADAAEKGEANPNTGAEVVG